MSAFPRTVVVNVRNNSPLSCFNCSSSVRRTLIATGITASERSLASSCLAEWGGPLDQPSADYHQVPVRHTEITVLLLPFHRYWIPGETLPSAAQTHSIPQWLHQCRRWAGLVLVLGVEVVLVRGLVRDAMVG